MKISKEDKLKILFVCFGNVCRSPMAEGIAQYLFGGQVQTESAGTSPSGEQAAEEAVQTMKKLYGVDISGHKPQHLFEVACRDFDYVIAMDSSVYHFLKKTRLIAEEKLYGWDIEDPLGLGIKAYELAARKIEERLEHFLVNREFEKKTK